MRNSRNRRKRNCRYGNIYSKQNFGVIVEPVLIGMFSITCSSLKKTSESQGRG